jgi:hypothetical protein
VLSASDTASRDALICERKRQVNCNVGQHQVGQYEFGNECNRNEVIGNGNKDERYSNLKNAP